MVGTELMNHEDLVESLTKGFGALLNQVEDLSRRNTDLERKVGLLHAQVSSILWYLNYIFMKRQISSRSRATLLAVIDNKPNRLNMLLSSPALHSNSFPAHSNKFLFYSSEKYLPPKASRMLHLGLQARTQVSCLINSV